MGPNWAPTLEVRLHYDSDSDRAQDKPSTMDCVVTYDPRSCLTADHILQVIGGPREDADPFDCSAVGTERIKPVYEQIQNAASASGAVQQRGSNPGYQPR